MNLLTIGITAAGKQREELVRTLRSYGSATSTQRGCLGVHLVQDIDNRNAITWIEEWESEIEFRRHVRSDAFRTLLAVIDMSMTAPDVRIHTVTTTRGMEWIATTRSN
jgi:quinol monooxygenase YgiN